MRLVGLNTALLSRDDNDKEKLRLGKHQIALALQPTVAEEVIVLLGHHPFDWLADGKSAHDWIASGAHLHLCGHVHEAEAMQVLHGMGSRLVRVTAGAVHGDAMPTWIPASHGYNFGEIIRDSSGRLHARVWPRRWAERTKRFRIDTDAVGDAEKFSTHDLGIDLRPVREVLPREVNGVAATYSPIAGPSKVAEPGDAIAMDGLDHKREQLIRRLQDEKDKGAPIESIHRELYLVNQRWARRAVDRSRPAPGTTLLDGSLVLVELLGEGGFGTVWKASDRNRAEYVAVKVLHRWVAEQPTLRERFFAGAHCMQALADLRGVVRVHYIAPVQPRGSWDFYVMELLRRRSLFDAISTGQPSFEWRLAIIKETAEVLEQIHRRGMLHRDVSPMNVMLGECDEPKLTDFDLVWVPERTHGFDAHHFAGLYVAPELHARHGAGARPTATPACDVWSLALTAVFAFRGQLDAVNKLQGVERLVSDIQIAPEIRGALARALALEVEQRTQTMREFIDDLRHAQANATARTEK